jgi:hypothetical protein
MYADIFLSMLIFTISIVVWSVFLLCVTVSLCLRCEYILCRLLLLLVLLFRSKKHYQFHYHVSTSIYCVTRLCFICIERSHIMSWINLFPGIVIMFVSTYVMLEITIPVCCIIKVIVIVIVLDAIMHVEFCCALVCNVLHK